MIIKNLLKKSAGFLVAATLIPSVGCGKNAVDLASAIPEDKAASINVPGGGDGQALVGERSEFYKTTYNISRGVNGGVAWVLGLSRLISKQEPTRVDGDTYTWGPSEPKGLEHLSWRFTATKLGEKHWTFKLDGREKGKTAESDFLTVYDGDVTRGSDEPARHHGTLNLYFDNAQALNQNTCGSGDDVLTGKAIVNFAADVEPKNVTVDFVDFSNTCDQSDHAKHAAKYLYTEATDGSGNFQFSAEGNIHKAAENKPALETLTMRSRWAADGKGRSDVVIAGTEVSTDLHNAGSMGNAVTAIECWDENFNVSYQTTEPTDLPQAIRDSIRPTEGQSSACVYTDTELPSDV